MGQERLGPSYFLISLVLGPLNSLFFFSRGLGWRMHLGVEVTELSTNKQHHLSACAKRAAYPDPPPVILVPESIAAQADLDEHDSLHDRNQALARHGAACTLMPAPLQSREWGLIWLCSQMHAPPQSVHTLLSRLRG